MSAGSGVREVTWAADHHRTTAPPPASEADGVALSIVVPVGERAMQLADLYREYAPALGSAGYAFEFLFVGGPWAPAAYEELLALARAGEPVRVLEVGHPMPEAALVRSAAAQCRGAIVLTLPAYHRVEAESLPELVRRVEAGADIAVARRWPRRDSAVNRFQNWLLHRVLAGLTGGRIHDTASGVRALRRDVLLEIPLYGEFSRFLPLLALREGYAVEEVNAPQHPADRGPRIYRPTTYLRRLLDVLGLFFLLRFTEKPLRFFGLVGSGLGFLGVLILAVGAYQRVFGGEGLADRPLLLLGVLLVVLGAQAVALGLIGEIIVHLHARRTPTYRVLQRSDRRL